MKLFRSRSLADPASPEPARHAFANKMKNWWAYVRANPKRTLLLAAGGLGVLFFGYTVWVLAGVPGTDEIKNISLADNSIIYDATGKVVLYSIHGKENRLYVPLSEISPHMGAAILAAEDADFYTHQGIDLSGMFRSVYFLLRTGEIRGGGSTLTQQFARSALLTPEQTLTRKLREIYLAFRLERSFSKDEILELYLNKVSFGNNAYGVERAARTYFDKSAKDLTLAESIVLASLPQAPTRWSPYGPKKEVSLNVTPEYLAEHNVKSEQDFWALRTEDSSPVNPGLLGKNIEIVPGVTIYIDGRVDYVLNQMKEKGFISDFEYQRTHEDLQHITFTPYREMITAPHFVFYVRDILEQELGKDVLEQAGLKIYTTLDADLQKTAEDMVADQAEINKGYGVTNLSLVAAEPKTGYIKAMVGSRNYWDEEIDGQVNVNLQRRQPGSSFKPITYAAAFLNGLAPATILFDVETKFGNTTPQNFSGTFRGPLSIRQALGNSLNIPALKAGILAGDHAVYDLARKMGFEFAQDADFYGAAIAIGSAEVTPLEMLQANAIFADGGKKIPLTPILWVEDKNGNILVDHREIPDDPEQVLDPETAYLVTDILSDPNARGPGWNGRLQLPGRKNAVKTGTSNAVDPATGNKYPNDNWTNGFTPQLATVVWAGNNRGFVKNLRADGFNNAAPLWKRFMEYYHRGKPAEDFERPPGIKTIAVERFSGKLPPPGLDPHFIVSDIFSSLNAPTEVGDSVKIIEVDKVSGKLPNEFTPPDAIERRAILNIHSERPDDPAWEIPVQAWLRAHGGEFLAAFGAAGFVTSAIPTETDDVHKADDQENKPTVSLLNPPSFGIVTPPLVDVVPDVSAPNGLKYIEIYWDDELKKTISKAPWNTSIDITGAVAGSTHSIKVRAVDQLYYADESTVQVKIGADSAPPKITFLFPSPDDTTIPGGVLHVFRVSSVDESSAVASVTFRLDGKNLGTDESAPFEMKWEAPNKRAEYQLEVEATDTAGNSVERSISFSTAPGANDASDNSFAVLSPANGSKVSSPLPITVSITKDQVKNFAGLEIWSRQDGGSPKMLQSFSRSELSDSGRFSTIWEGFAGEYELWAKLQLSSGGNQISPKVTFTVQ